MAKRQKSTRFVSRGGDKLASALSALSVHVEGAVAADLGANVGGFTDCLLQHGVKRVYAVETGYGVLEWKLRQDPRVFAMERTNALHASLPEPVGIVVADVGWTPLHKVVPAALPMLTPNGQILALLKHQYEARADEMQDGHVLAGVEEAIEKRVEEDLAAFGVRLLGAHVPDVDRGGRNPERFLLLCARQ